jgi:hypothetical protein
MPIPLEKGAVIRMEGVLFLRDSVSVVPEWEEGSR